MNETLSLRQAYAMCDEITNIVLKCVKDLETRNQEFAVDVSKIWEDNNAVECFKCHKMNMEDASLSLSGSRSNLTNTIIDIANSYSAVGDMPGASMVCGMIRANIDVSAVKEYFEGGNGDDFGFVNPASGVIQVLDAFNALKADLGKNAEEVKSKLNSINAFGNSRVKAAIAASAGEIVLSLQEHIKQAERNIKEYLEKTAAAYINVGQSAQDTMRGIAGEDGDVPPPTHAAPPAEPIIETPPSPPTYPAPPAEPIIETPPSPPSSGGHDGPYEGHTEGGSGGTGYYGGEGGSPSTSGGTGYYGGEGGSPSTSGGSGYYGGEGGSPSTSGGTGYYGGEGGSPSTSGGYGYYGGEGGSPSTSGESGYYGGHGGSAD